MAAIIPVANLGIHIIMLASDFLAFPATRGVAKALYKALA